MRRVTIGPAGLVMATASIALAVYAPAVARDLAWVGATDGGELITAAATLGVPHPPGYPTYVLLGRVFAALPFGTVAFRLNLFSAVCAAGAAGLLALTIRQRWGAGARPVVAAAMALAFAFSPLVWSQAVVAEVYTLNLLLVVAFLAAWLTRGPSAGSGLLLGLAITTHPTSVLLLPLAIATARRARLRLMAGCAAGLVPTLVLPWLAAGDSPVVWGRPATLSGWLWLVSGQLYAANFNPVPQGNHLAALWHALALGPAALVGARATAAPGTAALPTTARDRLPPGLLGATIALYFLFALTYATPDAAVLLLPAIMLLAVLAAPRLDRLGAWSLILPLLLALHGLAGRDTAGPSPRVLAEAALAATPSNALLLTPGDRSLFALWYFHHVENQRPDVVIVDANLFAFDWYRERLAAQYTGLFVPATDDLDVFRGSNAATRPVCTVSLVAGLPAGDAQTGRSPAAPPTLHCNEESP